MSVPATPATLRHRAAALRSLATAIERTPAVSLEQLAGDDTWRGARPQLCRNVLAVNLAQLHAAADDLRLHAWLFERQAHELERASLLAMGSAGSQAG